MGATGNADGMMNEFLQQPAHMPQSVSPMAMEQMRREFEALHSGTPQRTASPRWASEFDPGSEDTARMEAAFQGPRQARFSPADFERYVQMKTTSGDSSVVYAQGNNTGLQRPMGMGYGGMGMGMGMGMGSSYGYSGMGMQGGYNQPVYGPHQSMEVQDKGKGRMVELDDKDWEAQFAQLETHQTAGQNLDEEVNRAMEAELDDIDRSVNKSETDHFGDFESIWRGIQAEQDANRGMFDDVDEGKWRQHAGEFSEWDNFDMGLHSNMRDPQLGDYLFEEDNIFDKLSDPFGEGVRIMDEGGNLSLAALAFEAAVQKDPQHIEAWTRLGLAQAQNEKESPAIRALEQAIKLDPGNLDALMGLAVSYTNEGYDSTAYRTLERWLSTKYASIQSDPTSKPFTSEQPYAHDIGFTDRQQLHDRVTDLFIRAAQLSPSPEAMDPDVQVGLGVLFYGAEEFDKAVDCFSAALASSESGATTSKKANQRPLLWNRLGATLANSGRSEEAIQAYENALELNPNFVRARYNLGVSCINIGCYEEAAQHLLGALSMHSVVEKESRDAAREMFAGEGGSVSDVELERLLRQNQSTNLYDTLRRVFGQMGRKDLAERVVAGMDVDTFRGDFDF